MEPGTKVRLSQATSEGAYGVVIGEYDVPDHMRQIIRGNAGTVVTDHTSSWETQYVKVGIDIIRLERKP